MLPTKATLLLQLGCSTSVRTDQSVLEMRKMLEFFRKANEGLYKKLLAAVEGE